ncbi:MAG: hydroxyacid dehydrogenase [Phycisphaerae bacterium]|nr:hydroxyacid dehydrogenase [Phycisphaerae bacterium]
MSLQLENHEMQALMAVPQETFKSCFTCEQIDRLRRQLAVAPSNPCEELPETIDLDWIGRRIGEADILITGWGTPGLTDEIIARAPKLRAIAHSAGSIKHLAPASAYQRHIAVTNCRHALALGVAESTVGMIIAACKMFIPLDRVIERGGWRGTEWDEWVMELYNIRIGVVGASEVGKHLLNLLKSFQVERVVYDPYASAERIAEYGAAKVELDELCASSEVVVLCAPATDETRHMIGRRQLALMKDRVRFVNPSRGSIVDEQALIEKLAEGRMYAVLDVTDPEPPAKDNPLRQSPYCAMFTHIAGHASNGRRRQGQLVVEEIEKFLADGTFRWQVDPKTLGRMA